MTQKESVGRAQVFKVSEGGSVGSVSPLNATLAILTRPRRSGDEREEGRRGNCNRVEV